MEIHNFKDLMDAYQKMDIEKPLKEDQPVLEKIEQIIKNIQEKPKSLEKDQILNGVLRIIKKEKTAKQEKVQEIQKQYFRQISQPLKITIKRKDEKETFDYPIYYKKDLEKDSVYFSSIFSGKFEEGKGNAFTIKLEEITPDEFDKLIKTWAGDEKPENLEEAVNLLMLGSQFGLVPSNCKNMLLKEMSDWNENSMDDLVKISKIFETPNLLEDIKEELISYCEAIIGYYKNKEIKQKALEVLKRLEITEIELSENDEMDDLIKGLSQINTLKEIDLSDCDELTLDQVRELIKRLPHLNKLNINECEKITKENVQLLREENPKIEIIFKG